MKTYDVGALKHLNEINEAYERDVHPFFQRGLAYVEKHRDQATAINALRNKLLFKFEIAALQTIENPEHFAQILTRPCRNILTQDQIPVGNELDFFHVNGWVGRLPDVPRSSYGFLPFQGGEGRSISHVRITPRNRVSRDDFDAYDRCDYQDQFASCFVTVDSAESGTHICVEKDHASDAWYGPEIRFAEFYENAKHDLQELAGKFPAPHFWYVHIGAENNFEEVRFVQEGESGILTYRPRSIDVASVMDYRSEEPRKVLTLPDLLDKYEGQGKVGFGHDAHKAIRKDMLSLVFDAAREQLLDAQGRPVSSEAMETAKQLLLLSKDYAPL
ncbi:MAG: hypothetical protein PHX61_00115 [Alphaproteobacteria bacterium]|nr:hypothetical protein [Alphaproteobacteria bacterium]